MVTWWAINVRVNCPVIYSHQATDTLNLFIFYNSINSDVYKT